jgi:hypothetical protein
LHSLDQSRIRRKGQLDETSIAAENGSAAGPEVLGTNAKNWADSLGKLSFATAC